MVRAGVTPSPQRVLAGATITVNVLPSWLSLSWTSLMVIPKLWACPWPGVGTPLEITARVSGLLEGAIFS